VSTAYGRLRFGGGAYGGRAGISTPIGAVVVVFDLFGARKGIYQSGVGTFIAVDFSHDEAGCSAFGLHFAGYVDINRNDRVVVYLFDSPEPFFTGVVRSVPVQGSTSKVYDYAGLGLNDYLVRISTGQASYVGDTILDIVNDLVDSRIIAFSPIVKNQMKIQAPTTVVTQIDFKFVPLKDALEELQSIANADGNDYLFGVDSIGEFFFRPRAQEVKVTLVVGFRGRYGISSYDPKDAGEPKTLLHVLKNDGTYYSDFATTDGTIDVFEEKVTAPNIDDADLDNWALGQLWRLERYEREATIEWQIATQLPELLVGDGQVRVLCHRPTTRGAVTGTPWGDGLWGDGIWGGEGYAGYTLDDTLDVKRVEYSVASGSSVRKIQLGTRAVDLMSEMVRIDKDLAALRVSSGR